MNVQVHEDNMTDIVKLKLQQDLVLSQQELELLRQRNKTLHEAMELEGDDKLSKLKEDTQRLNDKYLALYGGKMELFEKKMEHDNQIRDLRGGRVVQAESGTPCYYPNVQRTLPLEEVISDPNIEVDHLKSVVEDRDKKIHNLKMQLDSFQDVASGKVHLENNVTEFEMKLENAEVMGPLTYV